MRAVTRAGLLLLAAAITLTPLASNDLWVHLSVGRETATDLAAGRGIPSEERFSFTAEGRPLVAHEWLTALIFYGIHRAAGPAGILALRLGLTLLTLLGLAAAARRAGAGPAAIGWTLALLLLAAGPRFIERPHLLTYALVAGTLAVLASDAREAARGGSRAVWLLPPACALWANLHGGFVIGFLLIGAFLIAGVVAAWRGGGQGERRRLLRLALALAAGVLLAGLLNPAGWRLLAFPFHLSSSPVVTERIYEWRSPLLSSYRSSVPFLLTVLWGGLLVFASLRARSRGGGRPPLPAGWFVAGGIVAGLFGLLALRQIRSLGDFVVFTAPWMAVALQGAWGRGLEEATASGGGARGAGPVARLRGEAAAGLAAAAAALLIAAFGYPHWPGIRTRCIPPLVASWVPVRAAAFLETSAGLPPGARLYNSYTLGGYLAWRLEDRARILIDSRNEAYGDALTEEILDSFRSSLAFDAALSRWKPDALVLHWRDLVATPLLGHLEQHPRWRLVYLDDHNGIWLPAGTAQPESGPREIRFVSPQGVTETAITPETAPDALEEGMRLEAWQPGGVLAALLRGRALLVLGRAEESVGVLRAAARATPVASPALLFLLAEALEASGDAEGAEAAARRARRLEGALPGVE